MCGAGLERWVKRSPSYTPHTQRASVPPEHTGALASLWPGERSSCTGCTGMTCPDSPCTGVHGGWLDGRYRVHRPHICVLQSLPAGRSAGPVQGVAADCAARLHAADSRCVAGCAGCADHAESVAAAVETWHQAAVRYHTQHSPRRSQLLEGWCGQPEVERPHVAARPLSCGLGCRDSIWWLAWPN